MIIKSLSRKSPSFRQLADYLASEKSDERFDLYRNCYAQNHHGIADEFLQNAQQMSKRRNGNYLYHEIISLAVEEGADKMHFKERLREIVDRYVEQRCPRNLVFGCIHEDHDHNLHYHLMISANERGERVRHRLTRKQFDTIKRDVELHVLEHYPELKQKELIGANKDGEKMSRKAGEVKRRLGELPVREEVKQTLMDAMKQTSSMDNFHFFLQERGFQFYVRGKNYGVEVTHEDGSSKKYRFSTLGLHDDFENFQDLVLTQNAEDASSTKSSDDTVNEKSADEQEQEQPDPRTEVETQSTKSEFAKDIEKIYEKKRQKRASKQEKTLKRKPRKR